MEDNGKKWVKVEMADSWNYKELGVGAELIGVFVNKEEHVGKNDSNVYTFELPDGTYKSVWGSTVLDARLKTLKISEEVKIVYLGLKPSEKRKGDSFHDFEVWHRSQEFKEAVDEALKE